MTLINRESLKEIGEMAFKWQQFCNEKARTWFGLYGFPSYPLSSVYFQRSSILRRKKKKEKRGRGLSLEWKHRLDEQLLVLFSRCCHRESLKEIGEMACVMSVWSSRGQTYRSSSWGTISCFSFGALWFANDTAPPTFFYVLLIIYSRKMQKSFIFINHGLC